MKRFLSFEKVITSKRMVKDEMKDLIVGVWTIEVEAEDEETYRVIGMVFKGNPDFKYDYSPVLICLDADDVESFVSEELYGYYREHPNPPKSRNPFGDIFNSLGSILYPPQTLAS